MVVSIVITTGTVCHLGQLCTFYNLDEVKIVVLITYWTDVNFLLPANVTTNERSECSAF